MVNLLSVTRKQIWILASWFSTLGCVFVKCLVGIWLRIRILGGKGKNPFSGSGKWRSLLCLVWGRTYLVGILCLVLWFDAWLGVTLLALGLCLRLVGLGFGLGGLCLIFSNLVEIEQRYFLGFKP